MSDATENHAPAPSPGLIARIAAAIANAPAPEPAPDAVALQSQLETLQADHNALTEAATAAADKLEAVQGELATTQVALEQKETILSALDSALPGASAAANVAEFIQAQITAKAQEQIAASGMKPDTAPAVEAEGDGVKTLSLDEFNKLPVAGRNEFIREGGKLK